MAGMTLLGALVGLLWRMAGSMPHLDPLRMLLYFTTVILVVNNAQAGVTTVGIVHRILILGSLIWLWDRRRGRRLAETAKTLLGDSPAGNRSRQIAGTSASG